MWVSRISDPKLFSHNPLVCMQMGPLGLEEDVIAWIRWGEEETEVLGAREIFMETKWELWSWNFCLCVYANVAQHGGRWGTHKHTHTHMHAYGYRVVLGFMVMEFHFQQHCKWWRWTLNTDGKCSSITVFPSPWSHGEGGVLGGYVRAIKPYVWCKCINNAPFPC